MEMTEHGLGLIIPGRTSRFDNAETDVIVPSNEIHLHWH